MSWKKEIVAFMKETANRVCELGEENIELRLNVLRMQQQICEHNFGLTKERNCYSHTSRYYTVCTKCGLKSQITEKEYCAIEKQKVIDGAKVALAVHGYVVKKGKKNK